MANRERCAGLKLDGEPCSSPFVGEDGFCDAHSPSRGGRDEMQRRGLRGALASRKSVGLDPDEIEELETHADVRRRLDLICRAVLMGRLRDGQAQAAIRACEAWLRARGEDAGRGGPEGTAPFCLTQVQSRSSPRTGGRSPPSYWTLSTYDTNSAVKMP